MHLVHRSFSKIPMLDMLVPEINKKNKYDLMDTRVNIYFS